MVGQDTITDGRTILIAILSIRFGYKKKNSVSVVFRVSLLGYLLTLV